MATHEDKLQELLEQMIQENENNTDPHDAAEYIKYIVRDMQARSSDVSVEEDLLLSLIDQITEVLSRLVDHNEYPYARIAFEEISNIYNILYPEEPNEEGE